ncbi:MAG: hypothetical protein P8Z36_12215, partial [Gemmatimonadota bacterium]
MMKGTMEAPGRAEPAGAQARAESPRAAGLRARWLAWRAERAERAVTDWRREWRPLAWILAVFA